MGGWAHSAPSPWAVGPLGTLRERGPRSVWWPRSLAPLGELTGGDESVPYGSSLPTTTARSGASPSGREGPDHHLPTGSTTMGEWFTEALDAADEYVNGLRWHNDERDDDA